MQNKIDRRWTKPELKVVGTLSDVAGPTGNGSQNSGGGNTHS